MQMDTHLLAVSPEPVDCRDNRSLRNAPSPDSHRAHSLTFKNSALGIHSRERPIACDAIFFQRYALLLFASSTFPPFMTSKLPNLFGTVIGRWPFFFFLFPFWFPPTSPRDLLKFGFWFLYPRFPPYPHAWVVFRTASPLIRYDAKWACFLGSSG